MQGTWELLHQIGNDFQFALIPDIVVGYKWVFLMMLFGFVLHWWPSRLKERYMQWFVKTPLWVKVVISTVVVFVIYQSISADMQPFIYFQF
jgi:alginate O-acetyltransferase complex protein AlgI